LVANQSSANSASAKKAPEAAQAKISGGLVKLGSRHTLAPQQLRQLGDVGRDAPRPRDQLGNGGCLRAWPGKNGKASLNDGRQGIDVNQGIDAKQPELLLNA
jgi:hypothetical protein